MAYYYFIFTLKLHRGMDCQMIVLTYGEKKEAFDLRLWVVSQQLEFLSVGK